MNKVRYGKKIKDQRNQSTTSSVVNGPQVAAAKISESKQRYFSLNHDQSCLCIIFLSFSHGNVKRLTLYLNAVGLAKKHY